MGRGRQTITPYSSGYFPGVDQRSARHKVVDAVLAAEDEEPERYVIPDDYVFRGAVAGHFPGLGKGR